MGFWKVFFSAIFILLAIALLGSYWMGFSGDGIELSESQSNSNFSLNEKNDSENGLEEGSPNGDETTNFSEEEKSQTGDTNFNPSSTEDLQFYDNLRYKDKQISYKISDECTLGKEEDAINAFKILENRTILDFYEVSEKPEILIACQSTKKPKGDSFVAGEGGPVNITQAGKFNVIHYGEVLLIEESQKSCPKPNVALHEILHALGFKHSENENNIMYETSKCKQELGQDLPKAIDQLYKIPSQPDLVLEEVSTNTHGRYLDFNASIRNNGLQKAEAFDLAVYTDDELLKKNEIKSLNIGFGTKIITKNIRFSKTDFDELRFEIESDYEEIENENNKIVFDQEK